MSTAVKVEGDAAARSPRSREPGATSDAGPEPARSGRPGRPVELPHEPALDGLRGLAVAVVVLFHLELLDGGFLGVDLFFVLSGFLITSLLVGEHAGRGSIDLARFWARRARRLLPALLLFLVGLSVLMLRLNPESVRAGFRGDVLSTLGYYANWHRMLDQLGYWDMFNQPSPLDHTWSLAIEEQFYLVWPVVAVLVLARWRRGSSRKLAVGALVGAAVSLTLLGVLYSRLDTNRAYFATDTRLGPTLLGAALALLTAGRLRRDAPPSLRAELAGAAALAWMTWSVVTVDGFRPWYYRGGLAAFAVAAVVAVHAVTGGPPGRLGRALSWRPLRALGTISYGVYLWHWPVIIYVSADRDLLAGWDDWALDLLRVGLTLAVATASYVGVERPIRRGAWRGRPRVVGLATVGGLAATLVAVLVATSGTPAATDTPVAARADGDLEGVDHPFLHFPADVPASTPRLLLVGDSGVASTGPALVREGERAGVAVAFSAQVNCSPVYADDVGLATDGRVIHRDCEPRQRRDLWRPLVEQFDPDVVVYYLANAGGSVKERVDGRWVRDCDPLFDDYMHDALLADLRLLARHGATVVVATSPYVGVFDPPSVDRIDCRNQVYRDVVADLPGARVVDLQAFVSHEIDTTDVDMFRDTIHLSDAGSRLASVWLLDQLPELA